MGLLRENTLRGHLRWRWPEHQLRMFSHSTVLEGPGPSSRCSKTSCFRALTAVFSNICSSCEEQEHRTRSKNRMCTPTSLVYGNAEMWSHSWHTWPRLGSWSPRPTIRMQSACLMQRCVQGVILLSVWYRTMRLMSSCWANQPDNLYSWMLGKRQVEMQIK